MKDKEIRFRISNQMYRWLDDQSRKKETTMAATAREVIADKMWDGHLSRYRNKNKKNEKPS